MDNFYEFLIRLVLRYKFAMALLFAGMLGLCGNDNNIYVIMGNNYDQLDLLHCRDLFAFHRVR